MTFQNLFDKQASDYAKFRPSYPRTLFELIAQHAPGHELAWDCGAGSGQAARSLADFFDKVIATDSSAAQIEHAIAHPKVQYKVAPSESSGLPDGSCDAVTAANALHWFDIPCYFAEVQRVLKPGGVVAVWCYTDVCTQAPMDAVVKELKAKVGPHWPAPISLVANKYRDVEFPFNEIAVPEIVMENNWTFDQCLGYFSTWSAVEKYKTATGRDVISDLRERFPQLAADNQRTFTVTFPLPMRLGTKKK